MGTVDSTLKLLKSSPLGTVVPPDSEPQTGVRGSCVHQSKDWDALYCELA